MLAQYQKNPFAQPFQITNFDLYSHLFMSVPPEKPRVFDERGQEVRLKLGPYKVGDTVGLKCTATGGKSIY